MTTLLNLIDMYLRSFLASFLGMNQPVALVLRARAAINKIAMLVLAELTPARPIHAPTLQAPA
jgi:hypothetical protein